MVNRPTTPGGGAHLRCPSRGTLRRCRLSKSRGGAALSQGDWTVTVTIFELCFLGDSGSMRFVTVNVDKCCGCVFFPKNVIYIENYRKMFSTARFPFFELQLCISHRGSSLWCSSSFKSHGLLGGRWMSEICCSNPGLNTGTFTSHWVSWKSEMPWGPNGIWITSRLGCKHQTYTIAVQACLTWPCCVVIIHVPKFWLVLEWNWVMRWSDGTSGWPMAPLINRAALWCLNVTRSCGIWLHPKMPSRSIWSQPPHFCKNPIDVKLWRDLWCIRWWPNTSNLKKWPWNLCMKSCNTPWRGPSS